MPYTPTYTYDAENRVKAVNGVTYTYDGDGNRVLKSSGTLYWGWGSGNAPLAESDLSASSASWKEYVFFNGKRVARRDASNSTVHYFFSNHVGSTSMIVNSSTGAVEEDVDYYPYGGLAYGTSSDHYLFDGKERDSETGNDNFGARYYGSGMGRFLTPDWAARPTAIPYAVFGDPQSLNLYTFVRNDPVTLADADGHTCNITSSYEMTHCAAKQENEQAAGTKANAEGAKQNNEQAKAAQNPVLLAQNTSPQNPGSQQSTTTAQKDVWVNPTGGAVRGCDAGGCGKFGAPRNEGLGATHGGTDYLGTPGQDVVAVHAGTVAGTGYAYQGDTRLQIVKIQTPNGYSVGELYVAPASGVKTGATVSAGQVIGTMQDIRVRTGPKVSPHIHVQIRDSGGQRVNPETLIPTP